jgi:Zn-dependent peptidase ImmA (M78 family)
VTNGVVGNDTHRKLDPEEFRGFVLADDYAPLVFINTVDGKAAQMFTLAHELAHVWFAQSAAFDLRDMQPARAPIEQACNRVAAEFLVPEAEMRAAWLTVRGQDGPRRPGRSP